MLSDRRLDAVSIVFSSKLLEVAGNEAWRGFCHHGTILIGAGVIAVQTCG
ncbi:MAG: hypothetical protein ACM3RX_04480 [Methanococcaceae archaeon]